MLDLTMNELAAQRCPSDEEVESVFVISMTRKKDGYSTSSSSAAAVARRDEESRTSNTTQTDDSSRRYDNMLEDQRDIDNSDEREHACIEVEIRDDFKTTTAQPKPTKRVFFGVGGRRQQEVSRSSDTINDDSSTSGYSRRSTRSTRRKTKTSRRYKKPRGMVEHGGGDDYDDNDDDQSCVSKWSVFTSRSKSQRSVGGGFGRRKRLFSRKNRRGAMLAAIPDTVHEEDEESSQQEPDMAVANDEEKAKEEASNPPPAEECIDENKAPAVIEKSEESFLDNAWKFLAYGFIAPAACAISAPSQREGKNDSSAELVVEKTFEDESAPNNKAPTSNEDDADRLGEDGEMEKVATSNQDDRSLARTVQWDDTTVKSFKSSATQKRVGFMGLLRGGSRDPQNESKVDDDEGLSRSKLTENSDKASSTDAIVVQDADRQEETASESAGQIEESAEKVRNESEGKDKNIEENIRDEADIGSEAKSKNQFGEESVFSIDHVLKSFANALPAVQSNFTCAETDSVNTTETFERQVPADTWDEEAEAKFLQEKRFLIKILNSEYATSSQKTKAESRLRSMFHNRKSKSSSSTRRRSASSDDESSTYLTRQKLNQMTLSDEDGDSCTDLSASTATDNSDAAAKDDEQLTCLSPSLETPSLDQAKMETPVDEQDSSKEVAANEDEQSAALPPSFETQSNDQDPEPVGLKASLLLDDIEAEKPKNEDVDEEIVEYSKLQRVSPRRVTPPTPGDNVFSRGIHHVNKVFSFETLGSNSSGASDKYATLLASAGSKESSAVDESPKEEYAEAKPSAENGEEIDWGQQPPLGSPSHQSEDPSVEVSLSQISQTESLLDSVVVENSQEEYEKEEAAAVEAPTVGAQSIAKAAAAGAALVAAPAAYQNINDKSQTEATAVETVESSSSSILSEENQANKKFLALRPSFSVEKDDHDDDKVEIETNLSVEEGEYCEATKIEASLSSEQVAVKTTTPEESATTEVEVRVVENNIPEPVKKEPQPTFLLEEDIESLLSDEISEAVVESPENQRDPSGIPVTSLALDMADLPSSADIDAAIDRVARGTSYQHKECSRAIRTVPPAAAATRGKVASLAQRYLSNARKSPAKSPTTTTTRSSRGNLVQKTTDHSTTSRLSPSEMQVLTNHAKILGVDLSVLLASQQL